MNWRDVIVGENEGVAWTLVNAAITYTAIRGSLVPTYISAAFVSSKQLQRRCPHGFACGKAADDREVFPYRQFLAPTRHELT